MSSACRRPRQVVTASICPYCRPTRHSAAGWPIPGHRRHPRLALAGLAADGRTILSDDRQIRRGPTDFAADLRSLGLSAARGDGPASGTAHGSKPLESGLLD